MDEAAALLEAAERIIASEREQRWCPHTPTARQAAFLEVGALEALFGGAAGGGKSDALLMGALQYVDVPGYSALILRRTTTDLALPGAIMDRAGEWLRPTAAHWNDIKKTWRFPSGATLTFGYLETEKDKYRYQGAELQFVAFDELTQFQESQYRYLLSRLRRVKTGALGKVPIRMRAATNPGGIGHAWVAARYGIDEHGRQSPDVAATRPFVPSTLEDNPHLDVEEYRQTLAQLSATERLQLERGMWVQDTTGLVLPLTSHCIVDVAPQGLRCVLGIDVGSSEVEETLGVSVVGWLPGVPGKAWVIHAEKHTAMLMSDLARRVRELEERFAIEAMILDEGALGAQFGRELRARFRLPVVAAQKANRVGYAKLFRDAARGAAQPEDREDISRLYVHREDAAPLVAEAGELVWHDNGRDMIGARHVYDASLYAWRRALAYLEEAGQDAPRPGTAEHEEAERVRRQMEATKRAQKRGAWWKGGR